MNIGNKAIQLLANFKVAVLRVQVIEPFDVQEKKMKLANKKKKEERKLKERLEFCERNGIDPYVRFGSKETFGLAKKREKQPGDKTEKKSEKISTSDRSIK